MRAVDACQRALAEAQSVDIGAREAEHPRPLDRVCAQGMLVSALAEAQSVDIGAREAEHPRPLDRACAQWMLVSALAEGQRADVGLGARLTEGCIRGSRAAMKWRRARLRRMDFVSAVR